MALRWFQILIYLFLFTGAAGQPLIKVTGTVVDADLRPLQQVTVSVLGQKESTLTDVQGQYAIYSRTTAFTLKYSLLGYQPLLIQVEEKGGARIHRQVIMVTNVNELEQITITNRQNQLSNTSTINIADISSLPAVSTNFEAILKTLPGVSTNNELTSQYSVRGGNFDENLIYVNDIEINRPILIRNAQQEGLSFINSDLVSRAKFSAGGFEARYGDKLSSMLDVRYDRPDSTQLMLTPGLMGSSLAYKRLNGKSHLLVGLRYKNNQSALHTQDDAGNYQPHYGDAQVLYQHHFSDKFQLSLLGSLNGGRFNLTPQSRETLFGTMDTQLRLLINYNGREVDDYLTSGLALTAHFSPRSNVLVKWINSYFHTLERERFDIEGRYLFQEVQKDFGGGGFTAVSIHRGIGTYLNYARNRLNSTVLASEVKVEHPLDNHVFSWGIRGERNEFVDQLSEYHLTDSAGYILPHDSNKFYLDQSINVNNKLNYHNISAYIQDSYRLSQSSDLQLGIRANYSSLSRQLLLSPRLLLAYRPSSDNKIFRFSAGIYQQPPSYRSIRAYDGALFVNQQAQRSYNFSGGLDYAFDGLGTRLKFSSEAYYKYADRLIPYIVDNVRIKYLSSQLAKGHTYGLDLNIGGEFVKDLVSYFRISLMKANQHIYGDSYDSGQEQTALPRYLKRPTDQRVNFSVFFQDRLLKGESYKVHLTMLYGSRLPIGAPHSERYSDQFHIPAYKRVDIGFSKDFLYDADMTKPGWLARHFSSFSAYVEVFNLLDINNTVSYLWLKDVDNVQYAIPNYLTGRQFNIKLVLKLKKR